MQYKITYSPKDAVIEFNTGNIVTGGGLEKITSNKREIEKAMLDRLIMTAYQKATKTAEINLALDLSRQLADSDDHLILQSMDLDTLRTTLEKLSGARDVIWIRLPELHEQIRNPEEIKEPEK